MCLPREEVFRNVQCEGHLWDLCISSDFVQDALDLGGTCGPCPSTTEDDLILLGSCPIETRSRSKLGEKKLFNLMSMLGGRDGGPQLSPGIDFISRIAVKDVSYLVDQVDGLVIIDDKSGASIQIRSDGTVTVDGKVEIVDFCFDYTISSAGIDGDGQSQDRIKATGEHCINVLPDKEYTTTVTELDLAPQKSMVAPLEAEGDLDEWNIVEVVVTDEKTGSSTTISSPKSGQVIELMNGNLTLTFTNDDPPQKIMAYTPNPVALREVGESDALIDSFEYAGQSSDGEVFHETVTFRVAGANDPPTPENDVSTVSEGDEAASCVLYVLTPASSYVPVSTCIVMLFSLNEIISDGILSRCTRFIDSGPMIPIQTSETASRSVLCWIPTTAPLLLVKLRICRKVVLSPSTRMGATGSTLALTLRL